MTYSSISEYPWIALNVPDMDSSWSAWSTTLFQTNTGKVYQIYCIILSYLYELPSQWSIQDHQFYLCIKWQAIIRRKVLIFTKVKYTTVMVVVNVLTDVWYCYRWWSSVCAHRNIITNPCNWLVSFLLPFYIYWIFLSARTSAGTVHTSLSRITLTDFLV